MVAANDRLRGRLHRLSSLPTEGVFNYTLLADTGIVSTKDHDLNFVPIGNVSDAHAAIDLKNGTGQLDLSVAVRGTTATIHMQLEPHNKIIGISSGADSVGAPSSTAPCSAVPEATAEFYGRDGEFLGVRFSYLDCHVLPEAVWEATKLGDVGSQGALVLRRSGN